MGQTAAFDRYLMYWQIYGYGIFLIWSFIVDFGSLKTLIQLLRIHMFYGNTKFLIVIFCSLTSISYHLFIILDAHFNNVFVIIWNTCQVTKVQIYLFLFIRIQLYEIMKRCIHTRFQKLKSKSSIKVMADIAYSLMLRMNYSELNLVNSVRILKKPTNFV